MRFGAFVVAGYLDGFIIHFQQLKYKTELNEWLEFDAYDKLNSILLA